MIFVEYLQSYGDIKIEVHTRASTAYNFNAECTYFVGVLPSDQFHEINSHEINSHKINYSRDQFPYDQLFFFL